MGVLVVSLLEARLRYLALALRCRGRVPGKLRVAWLHESCSRIRKRLSISLAVTGRPPVSGLVVSNHLSYLDVLLYGAVAPCGFVAKSEVRRWPLFGSLATAGGTVFVNRDRGAQSFEAGLQIERRIGEGIPVVLFAEGTSSDGSAVLPFRPPLFEPAIRSSARVTAAAIRYHASRVSEAEISYWGEMTFVSHLFRTLCLRELRVSIYLGEPKSFCNRKDAANEAWKEVSRIRESAALEWPGLQASDIAVDAANDTAGEIAPASGAFY